MQAAFNTRRVCALPRKFVAIDNNSDGLGLLVRTLVRKFPQATVLECQDAAAAVALITVERVDAIVAHATGELTGEELLRVLRDKNSEIPIIMVSGVDRSEQLLAAGATAFLSYDAWLNVGTYVANLLSKEPAGALR